MSAALESMSEEGRAHGGRRRVPGGRHTGGWAPPAPGGRRCTALQKRAGGTARQGTPEAQARCIVASSAPEECIEGPQAAELHIAEPKAAATSNAVGKAAASTEQCSPAAQSSAEESAAGSKPGT